ncbi:MAG: hypothetical protein ACFE7R_04435 [Candidatus Hodarchaeota archaeon]
MTIGHSIRIFFSSRTIGGFKGREGMAPVCYSCAKHLGIQRDAETREDIPPEAMPLIFSAQEASQELGVSLELVDVNRLTMIERIKEKMNGRPIPRVTVGDEFVTGCLSKNEIIGLYNRVYGHPR